MIPNRSVSLTQIPPFSRHFDTQRSQPGRILPAMANIDQHAPGSFSWIELATSDQAAAKSFYTSLFGWEIFDVPMGPDQVYTLFQLGGRDTAAAYQLDAEQKTRGVPTHWILYIAVTSADETAGRVAGLGGTVLAPPFDVAEHGRMAIIQDPTGASFSIWQPKQHTGIQVAGVDGTLCWADLNSPDRDKAIPFYSGLFRLEIRAGKRRRHKRLSAHQEWRGVYRRRDTFEIPAARSSRPLAGLFPGIGLRRVDREGEVAGRQRVGST